MLVTGIPLLELIRQNKICSEKSYDEFSISLSLHNVIYKHKPSEDLREVIYGGRFDATGLYEHTAISDGFLTLNPGDCVLACSTETISMPQGYLGLVQTKGTLARLFVSSHCSDSQVEPGYKGRVTLELINHSQNTIKIIIGAPIAQMYVFECTPKNGPTYSGRYQNAEEPTIPRNNENQ